MIIGDMLVVLVVVLLLIHRRLRVVGGSWSQNEKGKYEIVYTNVIKGKKQGRRKEERSRRERTIRW